MKIIAWNKDTNTAVVPERFPNNGEWARFTDGKRVCKKQYHPQPVPSTTTPRIISVDDFIDRIPRAAFEAITNSTSKEARAFVSMLNARNMIPLDNDKTVYYVGKMKAAGLITQAEHDTILG